MNMPIAGTPRTTAPTGGGSGGGGIVLPSGPPPLKTLPRFRVPDHRSADGYRDRPDLAQLQAGHGHIIIAAMRHPITDHQFNSAFDFQKCFFFVAREFPRLRGNIQPAQRSFDASVDGFSRPSRKEVEALSERDALSLPGLMKLALAFEAAIQHENHGAKIYFGLENGNPLSPVNGALIVPAMRSVDPTRIKEVRVAVRGDDDGFNAYAVRTGRSHVSRSFFTGYLERGVLAGQGGRHGHYLLTEPCANLVHSYLENRYKQLGSPPNPSKTDWWRNRSRFPTFDELFPNDPTLFPGGGLYCKPLPVRFGNFLK